MIYLKIFGSNLKRENMTSWWDLGEWSGFSGNELAMYKITCPFCMENGNFKVAFHAEKKKANSSKKLNFDTLKCNNCSGYVMALWSANDMSSGIHDYQLLPWSLRVENFPEYWPASVGNYWMQARRSLTDENWDAATIMARSALQVALRDRGAEGKNLKQEIDDLADKGILPAIMKEWSHNVRELGNESAHPQPEQIPTNKEDAKDIVSFLDFLLEYLYKLPKRIEDYRARNSES